MKKVAVVLASLEVGGAETRMLDILKNIDRKQYQLDFIILSDDENQFYESEVESYGAKVIKLNKPREISIFTHIRQLKSVFYEEHYSVVHSNTSYHSGIVLMIAYISGVKTRIAHARTNNIRHNNLKNVIMTLIGKTLIKLFATDRLAISQESARFLFGNNKKVKIVPDAININRFCYVSPQIVSLTREKLCIDKDTKIIGHVGRFDSAKNQEFVIRAFEAFHNEYYNSKLLLIGDGELINQCKKLAMDIGLKDDIMFLGRKSNVETFMHLFDVFLFPSKYEGLGNVALEAQAAGIPCICSTNVPQTVDMGMGLVSFLSLNMDMECWKDEIKKVIGQKITEPSIIFNAFSQNNYTIEKAIKLLSEVYSGGMKY